MRKVLVILLIPFMVMIGGCKSTANKIIPKIDSQIENNVKISSNKGEYECKVFFTPEGAATINFISPTSLREFVISRKGGKYEISHGELTGEYIKDPIQSNCAIKYLLDILEELSKEERSFKLKSEEEREKTYVGIVNGEKCSVVLSEEGEIIRILIESLGVSIDFNR